MPSLRPDAGDPTDLDDPAELDDDALAAHYAYPADRRPPRTSGSTSWPAPTARCRWTGVRRPSARTPTSGSSACCGSWPTWCWSGRARCGPRTTAAPAGRPGVVTPRRRSRWSPDRPTWTRRAGCSPTPRCRRSCSPCATAPAERRERLVAAGGDVVVLDRLTPDALLAELARRGLHRVLCEGGPSLFGALIAADAVDELCLTVAPLLAGGTAGRIARGPAGTAGPAVDAGRGAAGGRRAAAALPPRLIRSGDMRGRQRPAARPTSSTRATSSDRRPQERHAA